MNKSLIEALRILKEHCEKHEFCTDCPFDYEYGCQITRSGSPEEEYGEIIERLER